MNKAKKKFYVWLYMGVLCCIIVAGVIWCVNVSGAGVADLATQRADAATVFQIEDEEVPLADGNDQ